jgi:serine/threonine protein kinase
MNTDVDNQPLFGRYLLLNRIATGGMAEIFRALACGSEGFRKLVAIKRMLPEISEDSEFVAMFVNEAKLVANLHHANIVQLYDFGRIDEVLFYSMEYVHGRNTADIIYELATQNRQMPLDVACHILIQALEGLDYAHRQCDSHGNPFNIIHRDMSPHNIIVSYDGLVKIADFGIAKASRGEGQTAAGVIKGKFRYMSPEQSLARNVDQRTDIFTLGISFYEMLTLSDMFAESNEYKLLKRVRKAEFDRPRNRNKTIPIELEDILLRTLSKNPDKRYANARELRDVLTTYLADNHMRPVGSACLVEFMREMFGDDILQEREQIAREVELAEETIQTMGDLHQDGQILIASQLAERRNKRKLDETLDERQQWTGDQVSKLARQAARESRPTLELSKDRNEESEIPDPDAPTEELEPGSSLPLEKRRTVPVRPDEEE